MSVQHLFYCALTTLISRIVVGTHNVYEVINIGNNITVTESLIFSFTTPYLF